MDMSLMLSNLLSPPILFFLLGVLAVAVKSDLDIPQPLSRLFSLYLLVAIGFKGGVELRHAEWSGVIAWPLMAAVLMACAVPVYTFFILRLRMDVHNAGAIAATYGSVSAVTFITATGFIQTLAAKDPSNSALQFGGHMVAAMALMESPAIVVVVVLVHLFSRTATKPVGTDQQNGAAEEAIPWSHLLRDALFNQSVLLLIGSLLIGMACGPRGEADMAPFLSSMFKGMLSLFLLDLGLVAARRGMEIRKAGMFLVGFAIVVPILNAMLGMMVARMLRMSQGDALLFTMLCGSASYIAVPAAMRLALPQANPGYYVPMALAVTFPFNIVVGMPAYMWMIGQIWN